jgi:hypothetical protein
MPSSLFRRVTRYRASASVDPRENRLTEATAATLEQVDGLALSFVRQLLLLGERDAAHRGLPDAERTRRRQLRELGRELVPDRVSVRTQVPTNHGRYIDLEVLLRPRPGAHGHGLLLWVEVKHGADLHGDQVDAYLQDITAEHPGNTVERIVVLLGPRGWEPAQPVPETVLRADWQGVARELAEVGRELRVPEQRWLLGEYIRYLKEEGLSDPDALTVTSALALMHYEQAEAAAAGICEHADAYVTEHWNVPTDRTTHRGEPAYGLAYRAAYDACRRGEVAHPRWGSYEFKWALSHGPSLQYVDQHRGTYVFTAGAATYYAKDEASKRAGNEGWMARRQADGFQRAWLTDYLLVRLRYPDELLVASTLETQGRTLGAWIVEAFEALGSDPPDQ